MVKFDRIERPESFLDFLSHPDSELHYVFFFFFWIRIDEIYNVDERIDSLTGR